MRTPGSRFRCMSAAFATLCVTACPSVRVPELAQTTQTPVQSPTMLPLKVHLMSGQLLVLQQWRELPADAGVTGVGTQYDVLRHPVGPFDGSVPHDSIALLEITRSETVRPAGSVVLGAYTVLATVLAVTCLADPKSCFGSCPTFYLNDNDQRPVAEGFSASVARSLEATDVDDIGEASATGRTLRITMRNEALETHFVRSVRLLVVPRPPSGAVVRDVDGGFLLATASKAPASCQAGGRDCVAKVTDRDGSEWTARVDSTDLNARDSIDLTFPAGTGSRALLVAARQSFVSTYVFYQSMAFAGSRAGELLAEVERRGTAGFPGAWTMMQRLAQVELLAGPQGGALQPIGSFGEAGPIATDQHVIRLPAVLSGAAVHVRLRFARGGWRFDRLALVHTVATPAPIALEPVLVERHDLADPAARARLLDTDRYLVTEPGDSYRLTFALPERAERLSFFLESRGYYYEWMRPEWMREENPAMLSLIALAPGEALRRMAPGYSRIEPQLDSLFWSSRFGRR